ncbi:hypothetical protein HXX76_011617 [Chlamydomonas incerta]|uniref:Uncharacterized protein n=1 Tax=Chlamydomonas incerta TaxID=51695 RepID=A0A835VUL6_CHLIN|nr:hypothetical protein HXX76_011617 [Chlamydomonas incerta]|eukprot:KAG2428500.1 hypothetical protein HXX76_011617 [Chlamydomonas incerta]
MPPPGQWTMEVFVRPGPAQPSQPAGGMFAAGPRLHRCSESSCDLAHPRLLNEFTAQPAQTAANGGGGKGGDGSGGGKGVAASAAASPPPLPVAADLLRGDGLALGADPLAVAQGWPAATWLTGTARPLRGAVAALLIYTRSLDLPELADPADHYRPRFGFNSAAVGAVLRRHFPGAAVVDLLWLGLQLPPISVPQHTAS